MGVPQHFGIYYAIGQPYIPLDDLFCRPNNEPYLCYLRLAKRLKCLSLPTVAGLALMAEGFMSVAYHICPGKANYQFDTTFMFVLSGLGIFKILESRNPDLHPGLHKLLVLLAAMIVMIVVGVVSS